MGGTEKFRLGAGSQVVFCAPVHLLGPLPLPPLVLFLFHSRVDSYAALPSPMTRARRAS